MKRITTGSTLNHGDHWWLALVCGLLLAVIGAGLPGALSSAQAHDFGGGTNPNPPPPPPPPPPPCQEQCCPTPDTGKPVSPLDGAERMHETELRLAGVYPIVITRDYDSSSTYDTPLGYGWAFGHDRRLFEYADGSVVIRSGCGHRDRYTFTGSAYVTPTTGVRGQLRARADGSFVFAYYNGTFDYYDAEGRLVAEQDAQGNSHEILYIDNTGDGRPDKFPLTGTSPTAVDPNLPMTVAYVYRVSRIQERSADGTLTGRRVNFAYDDATGRLVSITSDDGRLVTYSHDQAAGATRGNLIEAAGPGNRVQTFAYADPQDAHNATTIQLGTGETPYLNTYDAQGRVTVQMHGTGKLAFTYPVSRGRTVVTRTVTDPAETVLYTTQTTYEMDTDGFPTSTTDALGNQTRYSYNAAKNLTREEIWDKRTGALLQLKATNYGYDALGNRISATVTLDTGEVITRTWTYDQGWVTSEQVVSSLDPANVFRTEYTLYYDGQGVPNNIKEAKRRRNDGSFQTTTFTYDAKRRLLTTTLPDGVQKVNQYAGGSLYVTKTYFKDSAGNVLPQSQQRFGYDAKGNQTDIWDARGNHTQIEYDNQGHQTRIINPLGEERIYTFANNRLTQIEAGRTASDGEGQITQYIYDQQARLTGVRHKNDQGDFITVLTFTYDSDGHRLTRTDAENRTTRFAYDALGRLASNTDALGNTTTLSYDAVGNLLIRRDANSRETRYTYDDLNRQIRIEQRGIDPSTVTVLAYDANGNLTAVTDPSGNQTRFAFDALSHKTAEIKPLGQTLQYAYDNRSRLANMITARGYKIEYDYAPWGPLISTEVFKPDNSGTTPDSTIRYDYDLAGNVTNVAYSDIQPLTRPLYSIGYDALDRPDVTTVNYVPNKAITLDHEYDRYGNLSRLVVDDGAVLTHDYTFDKLNRLTGVSLPGNYSFTLDYYGTGDRKNINRSSGPSTSYTYYANGPVKDITIKNSADSVIERYAYTYDPVLNVDTMTDSDGVHDYAYDGLNRLTEAQHPAGVGLPAKENFAYDPIGNREDPVDPNLYQYDANSRITNGPGLTYTFDADGNQTRRSDGAVLVYDGFNQLTGYTKGTTSSGYAYSPQGERLRKTSGGQTTFFLWDGNRLLAEYDSSGVRQERYAYLPGDQLPQQTEYSGSVHDVHGDQLQTPHLLTSAATQTPTWRARYEAYGRATVTPDADGDGQAVTFNMRFPGQYFDQGSGLNYNFFRTYDPQLGRYIEVDPIGIAGGLNPYAYAKNNPVNASDPLGLWTWCRVSCNAACWGVGGGICAAVACGCAAGTVVTIGGLAVPCTAVVIGGCAAGGGASSLCADIICEEICTEAPTPNPPTAP